MKKLVTLLLAVMLLWPCIVPFVTVLAESVSDPVNELHFIVRHWHTKDDSSGSMFENGSLQKSGDRYFVVVEGYIIPPLLSGTDRYEFDLVDTSGKRVRVHSTDGVDNSIGNSSYVDALDHDQGIITFSTNTLYKGNQTEAENFSAYSVSAGHEAVNIQPNSDKLTIHYDENVHLVKAHAFYVKTTVDTENGTQDDTVFGTDGIAMSAEQDTAMVYTYKDGVNRHKKGDIVMGADDKPFTVFKTDENGNHIVDTDGKPLMNEAALKAAGFEPDEVEVTKVYDSSKGLHTDKTASVNTDDRFYVDVKDQAGKPTGVRVPDGRTFDLDLETWHSEGLAPQIGMVLDASGSMSFASDKPTPIKVEAGTEAYSALMYKMGTFDDNFKIDDPFIDKLLGYYEFRQNSNGLQRNWYLNSKKHQPSNDYSGEMLNRDHYAKFVLQPTGDEFDFSKAQQKTLIACDDEGSGYTGWGVVPANFSEANGFNLTYQAASNSLGSGILLESVSELESGSFTLSFSLIQRAAAQTTKDVEILYIGPEKGNIKTSSYFHVIRHGDDIVASFVLHGEIVSSVTLPAGFTDDGKQRVITFAYQAGQMTAYLDGLEEGSVSVSGLNPEVVVFTPFKNQENTTTSYFWLDNIFLLDAALNSSEINTLISVAGQPIDVVQSAKGIDAFLTPGELALLMNSYNTDNSPLGWAGYSYFVYNPTSGTTAYAPLAYYNNGANGAVFAQETNIAGKGWYYVTGANWTLYAGTNYVTGKSLRGLVPNYIYEDTIVRQASLGSVEGKGGAAPDVSSNANTGFTYTNAAASPNKFYLDSAGYLRCFYTASDKSSITSYVYELEDNQYIRTEALQRALGLFVTALDERSPSARVSAVRFSGDKASSEMLVLLDWTDDPAVSTGMLSLGQENGTNKYALTGGTDTASGLNAYIQHLAKDGKDNPYDPSAGDPPKYLILFTDGANTGDVNAAKVHAATLKKADYTIYAVLLDGGSMSAEEYASAKEFLTSLAGKKDSASGEDYFYSTKKARADQSGKYDGIENDTDILTNVFVDEILNRVVEPLEHYTVQDYIDPRFDLVDKDGIIWHLNAHGIVTKEYEGELDLSASGGVTFPLSDHSDEEAREPSLRYDAAKDMYYLVWEDQTIPTSAIGANRLPVWNVRVTIRAKDDFLGGNAIVSNGNDKEMNWVYNEKDRIKGQASSGTNFMIEEKDQNGDIIRYASKGFPRTAVNVTPAKEELDIAQIIYMSEELHSKEIAVDLIRTSSEQATGLELYYWEYLERFVTYFNQRGNLEQLEALATRKDASGNPVITDRMKETAEKGELSIETLTSWMVEDREKGLTLPYIYLPALDGTNSTGTEIHRRDVIGQLNFIIKETFSNAQEGQVPEGYDVYPNGPTTHTLSRKSELKVTYSTEDSVTRMAWNNTNVVQEKDANGDLVYRRNPRYKPVPGTKVEDDIVIEGEFETEIVSGEIALKAFVSDEVAAKLKKLNLSAPITYTADLVWTHGTFASDNGIIVGTFTVTIDPRKDKSDPDFIKVSIKYTNPPAGVDEKNGQTKAFLINPYGLPMGSYTLKNGKGNNLPVGYGFSAIQPISDSSAYDAKLFELGTDHTTPAAFIATLDGDSFILGNQGSSNANKRYTDYRFGLYMVTLEEQSGNLKINKIIVDEDNAGANNLTFTFRVTGPAEVAGMTFDLEDGGNVTFPQEASPTVTVTVTGAGSVTIKGLPAGQYQVEELQDGISIDGYELGVDYNGNAAIRESNQTAEVDVTNTYTLRYGDLVIRKDFDGDLPDGADSRQYTFTVTGPELVKNQTYGSDPVVTFDKNGQAEVSVTGANSTKLKGLPVGKYTVTEVRNTAEFDGYDLTVTVNPSEILVTSDTTKPVSVTVTNTYTAQPGSLTITKALGANAPSEASTKTYTFTVSGPEAVKGRTYGDVTFDENGKATVTVTGAGSVTITGLPAGTYSVTEQRNGTAITGYDLEVRGEGDATITNGGSASVTVTNTYTAQPGSLTITKALGANAPSEASTKTYTFTISGPEAVKGRTYGNVTFDANGKATVTVTGAGSVTITGLPAGTYSVTEERNGTAITGYDLEVGGEGDATISNGGSASVTVTNTYTEKTPEPTPNLGDLIISKTVTGNAGNKSQEFNFMVMLSDRSINGIYGDITFHDGVASFTLKHGERKIATGLPSGIHYSVTELSAEQAGYTVTSMNAEGVISSSQSAEALFINAREEADVPQTGDNSHLEQWIAMAILAVLGMAVSIFILRKDMTDRKRIR